MSVFAELPPDIRGLSHTLCIHRCMHRCWCINIITIRNSCSCRGSNMRHYSWEDQLFALPAISLILCDHEHWLAEFKEQNRKMKKNCELTCVGFAKNQIIKTEVLYFTLLFLKCKSPVKTKTTIKKQIKIMTNDWPECDLAEIALRWNLCQNLNVLHL